MFQLLQTVIPYVPKNLSYKEDNFIESNAECLPRYLDHELIRKKRRHSFVFEKQKIIISHYAYAYSLLLPIYLFSNYDFFQSCPIITNEN